MPNAPCSASRVTKSAPAYPRISTSPGHGSGSMTPTTASPERIRLRRACLCCMDYLHENQVSRMYGGSRRDHDHLKLQGTMAWINTPESANHCALGPARGRS